MENSCLILTLLQQCTLIQALQALTTTMHALLQCRVGWSPPLGPLGTCSDIGYHDMPGSVLAFAAISGLMSYWLMAPPWSSPRIATFVIMMCLTVVFACAAVSGLTCCAFGSVLMHCPSITRSIWSILATSCLLAWRECGGGRRRENPARIQLAYGQCTQPRNKSLKASAGLLTELRLAKVDSSQAGTCMSCEPEVWFAVMGLGNMCLLLRLQVWFFMCLPRLTRSCQWRWSLLLLPQQQKRHQLVVDLLL